MTHSQRSSFGRLFLWYFPTEEQSDAFVRLMQRELIPFEGAGPVRYDDRLRGAAHSIPEGTHTPQSIVWGMYVVEWVFELMPYVCGKATLLRLAFDRASAKAFEATWRVGGANAVIELLIEHVPELATEGLYSR